MEIRTAPLFLPAVVATSLTPTMHDAPPARNAVQVVLSWSMATSAPEVLTAKLAVSQAAPTVILASGAGAPSWMVPKSMAVGSIEDPHDNPDVALTLITSGVTAPGSALTATVPANALGVAGVAVMASGQEAPGPSTPSQPEKLTPELATMVSGPEVVPP